MVVMKLVITHKDPPGDTAQDFSYDEQGERVCENQNKDSASEPSERSQHDELGSESL